jgi:hypothetical protein
MWVACRCHPSSQRRALVAPQQQQQQQQQQRSVLSYAAPQAEALLSPESVLPLPPSPSKAAQPSWPVGLALPTPCPSSLPPAAAAALCAHADLRQDLHAAEAGRVCRHRHRVSSAAPASRRRPPTGQYQQGCRPLSHPPHQRPAPAAPAAAPAQPSPDPAACRLPASYSCYYLTRNSLTYTAPVMVADARLGMDITQIGAQPPAARPRGSTPCRLAEAGAGAGTR